MTLTEKKEKTSDFGGRTTLTLRLSIHHVYESQGGNVVVATVPGVRSGPRFNSVDRIECLCVYVHVCLWISTRTILGRNRTSISMGYGGVLFKQINLSLMRLSAAATAIVAMGFALITCEGWRCVSAKGRNYYYYVSGLWKVIVRPSQV